MLNDETTYGLPWVWAREEDSLVRLYRVTGDSRALDLLLESQRDPLRRLLLVLLSGNHEQMAEAEREVVAVLARSLRFLSPETVFADHLYRAARRIALRRPSEPPGDLGPLFRSFCSLPADDRLLLLLHEVEHLDREAIARRIRRPPGLVHSRLLRAREKLARLATRPDDRDGAFRSRYRACCLIRDSLQELLDMPGRSPRLLDYELMAHLQGCPDCREFRRFLVRLPENLSAALEKGLRDYRSPGE